MKKGKLFFLLKQLSSEEFKDLKKVIHSPFFNGNRRLYDLYEALTYKHPNYVDTEKYRQRLYQKAYPGEEYSVERLRQLFSALSRVIEEYLLILNIRTDPRELRRQRIKLYANRQMQSYFEKETKALAAELEASLHRDMEYYEAQIFLHEIKYFHPQHNKYDLKDTSLDNLVDALDKYFALAKMRFGISVKSRERILAKPGIWRFTNAMKAETGFMQESVLFQLYELAFSMLYEEGNFNFVEYERLLFDHIDELRIDGQILFFAGLNFVNRQVNIGHSEFSRRALDWHKLGLKKELFFLNGQMSDGIFCNIVIYGCQEKEFGWTRNFIENYKSYLDENRRQEVISYNQGMLHFYKREFENVYSLWQDYPFSYEYAGRTRLTTIRALFELFLLDDNYFEVLNSNIKSFEIFIFRDTKHINTTWKPYLNCIRIVKKTAVFLMDNVSNMEVYDWLAREIEKSQKIISKAWLKEKMEQIGQ